MAKQFKTPRGFLRLAWGLIFLGSLPSCGYLGASAELGGLKGAGGVFEKASIDYNVVKQQVFEPRCVGCHRVGDARGGVRVDSFQAVQANLEGIRQSVLRDRSMPKGPPLTPDQIAVLNLWLNRGAPENAKGANPGGSATPYPPQPTPPAPVPKPEATFAYIKTVLFTQHACYDCHGEGKRVADMPLDTIESLKISGDELVVPGDPDASVLVQVLEKPNRGRMPPVVSRDPGLTPAEVAVVRLWIQTGAKD